MNNITFYHPTLKRAIDVPEYACYKCYNNPSKKGNPIYIIKTIDDEGNVLVKNVDKNTFENVGCRLVSSY